MRSGKRVVGTDDIFHDRIDTLSEAGLDQLQMKAILESFIRQRSTPESRRSGGQAAGTDDFFDDDDLDNSSDTCLRDMGDHAIQTSQLRGSSLLQSTSCLLAFGDSGPDNSDVAECAVIDET